MGLKRDFASGVFYTAVAKYSGLIVQILITAVLARLLSPSDFGVVAIATILIQLFNTVSEAGIGPAIIQKKDLTKKEIESIFTITIIIGIILSFLFYFSSSIIANYYNNQELKPICQWLSLLVFFSSADIVTNSLLLKQKKFKVISIRTITIQIVTGILSIYTAYIGWGAYALILSAISSKILIFIANYWLNPILPKFKFRVITKIVSYSSFQFCFNLVNYFSRNADKLIVGKFIGMSQLGYYEKSYRLMMLPLSNITYVLTPVIHPVFSELQNDRDKLFQNYAKLLEIISLIAFPITVFLFFNAKELVLIFFGAQWEASVLPFKILALTAATQVLHATCGGVFQAIDDTKGLFLSSLYTAVIMIGGFLVSALMFKTIVAVSYSFLITCTLGCFIVFKMLFKAFDARFWVFFKIIEQPFYVAIIEFVILSAIEIYVPLTIPIWSLIIKTLVLVFITLTYLYLFKYNDIKNFIKTFKK